MKYLPSFLEFRARAARPAFCAHSLSSSFVNVCDSKRSQQHDPGIFARRHTCNAAVNDQPGGSRELVEEVWPSRVPGVREGTLAVAIDWAALLWPIDGRSVSGRALGSACDVGTSF
jgi:hypothetical protein